MRRPLLAASLLLLGLTSCCRNRASPPAAGVPLAEGSSAAGPGGRWPQEPLRFTVKRHPGGEPFDIGSERGKVVLLDVWATWCEPCKETLPYYERLARELGPQGLVVYLMSIDEDARAVADFVAETKLALPVLLDANALVAERALRVQAMPTAFLVDRSGRVRHVHEGVEEGEEGAKALYTRTRAEAERLLQEPAPSGEGG